MHRRTGSRIKGRNLCQTLHVTARTNDGLQGELIHGLAGHLCGPDEHVRRWLRDDAVPLGIERPIEPAGISPAADPKHAEAEHELYCGIANYSSYELHQEGAYAISQKELDNG